MERKILFLSMLVYTSLHAQLQLGLKAGITLPSLESSTQLSGHPSNHRGLYAGIQADFRVTNLLSVMAEVNFSQQGGQRNGIQPVPSAIAEQVGLPSMVGLYADYQGFSLLDYIEIPIMVKLSTGTRLKYYACAGPYIAFMIGARKTMYGNSILYTDENGTLALDDNGMPYAPIALNTSIDIQSSIKTANFGIQAGLGLEYPIAHGRIFLESRSVIGLTNIIKNAAANGKQQTGSLAIAVGYKVNIK